MQDVDSHLISTIYTNVPPSLNQKRQIKGLIAALKAHVAELDEDMARIQAKKDICLRQIHTYAAALSPCRRLPPELVSEIFLYVKERTWFSHGSPRPCLSLSQICSAWREVAINTAGLWTNIQIGYQQKRFPKKLLLLQMFFERTGEFPLSLGISTGVENLGSHEDLMMNILTPYFTRMQYLTMAAPYSCFAKIASLPPIHFLSSKASIFAHTMILLGLLQTPFWKGHSRWRNVSVAFCTVERSTTRPYICPSS